MTNDDLSSLDSLLDIKWQNIQHNELSRDQLFRTYILISGAFFISFQIEDVYNLQANGFIPLVASIFIMVIGLIFIWEFIRYKEMINRDIRMVRSMNSLLETHDKILAETIKISNDYFNDAEKKHTIKRWATTNATIATVCLVSSGIVTIGIWACLQIEDCIIVFVLPLFIIFHFIYYKLIKWLAT